ncbi:hypothetical protein GCM10029992_31460 [Glycomyces albus]
MPWRGRWENEGGGPTMGHGIHQFDLLLSILGPWTEVAALAGRLARPTDTEDVSMAVVRFDNGCLATVVNSVVSPRESSRLRFDFEHATVEVEHLYGYTEADWRFTPAPGHEHLAELWRAEPGPDRASGHPLQIEAVLVALAAGEEPAVSLDEARRTLEFAAATYASAFGRAPSAPETSATATRSRAAWTAAPSHGTRSRSNSHDQSRHPPRPRCVPDRPRRPGRPVRVRVPARHAATGVAQAVHAPDPHPRRTRGEPVPALGPRVAQGHRPVAAARGEENFWGGPTYVHGRFYVQKDNNGTQQHREFTRLETADGAAAIAHDLDWITQAGAKFFTEKRAIGARVISDEAWMLTFETSLTNVSGGEVSIGSPTTKGRENAGYGGLFWRGPRSFTDCRLVTADGSGPGSEMRGGRHEWMGFAGRHDHDDATSLVLMVDDADNPQHPPQWFARSEEFAALNPAPFFSEELAVADGETIRFRYGIAIADADEEAAPGLAAEVRTRMPHSFNAA